MFRVHSIYMLKKWQETHFYQQIFKGICLA